MKLTEQKIRDLISQITIAQIKTIQKHEDADRLLITQIEIGDADVQAQIKNEDGTVQIVTGATNIKEGDLVPFLAPGKVVPGWLIDKGEEIVLESRKMRGQISHGMILAEDEIGLGSDHAGIYIIETEKLKNEKTKKEDLIGISLVEFFTEEDWAKVFNKPSVLKITPELQARIDLIKSIGNPDNGGEIVGGDELAEILTSGEELFTYDGFEPSGQMHIAQGIIRAINTNKMIEAGFTFKMWVADWFGFLNNKMGGDLNKIKRVGEYFIEIWKAAGMNLDKTMFLWTSDFVGQREYWELMMKVSKASTLKRVLRTTEIMGRSENDDLSAAQILYPCMQITDIFHVMKCQVTQLGLDQRKVNMLAREVGPELGFWKPVIVSHGMLQGLGKPLDQFENFRIELWAGENPVKVNNFMFEVVDAKNPNNALLKLTNTLNGESETFTNSSCMGLPREILGCSVSADPYPKQSPRGHSFTLKGSVPIVDAKTRAISMKMSKSKPDTAIFMTDTAEDVKRKIMNAYAPEGISEDNPVLDYCKQIIFESAHLVRKEPVFEDGKFLVERDEKFGGNVSYSSYKELKTAYENKELFPLDLKNAVVKYINKLLQPVRDHFENDDNAKALLEEVRGYQVTR
jgi:tyrosyl-tRNA synthetase/tRNA-binding EMAP/Myf-like protein